MRIGMDFGTTNSGIAVYDGQRLNVIKLDPEANGNVMRSVIYLTKAHELHVGEEAIRLYNAQNIDRERKMVNKVVGRVSMTFAEVGTISTFVTISVDELEPGKLMRSMKSVLATPYTSTKLYGHEYSLEDLIALYLRRARENAERTLGEPIREVVLGRPVHFVSAETDEDDQRIVENALLPHFGSTLTWGDKKLPVPRSLIEQVTAWEGLAGLANLETRAFLQRMQAECATPARLYALESLIFNFYGFALFEAVEASKRRLSESPFDAVRFVGTDIDIWHMLTRSQFENFAMTEWRKIRQAITETVERSGLAPEQIDAVVRTGGSSSIPFGLTMLGEMFGPDKIVEEDLFTGVTAGLALCAWDRR